MVLYSLSPFPEGKALPMDRLDRRDSLLTYQPTYYAMCLSLPIPTYIDCVCLFSWLGGGGGGWRVRWTVGASEEP